VHPERCDVCSSYWRVHCGHRPDTPKVSGSERDIRTDRDVATWNLPATTLSTERAPKDVRPASHKIKSDPRKPRAEACIEKRDDEPVRVHDGSRSETRSTSGTSGTPGMRSAESPLRAPPVRPPPAVHQNWVGTGTTNVHRLHSLSALCANAHCRAGTESSFVGVVTLSNGARNKEREKGTYFSNRLQTALIVEAFSV
jgi:hypothetical protein